MEGEKKDLAATYSPTDGPQYHRRAGVSLTCSGWERVFQPGYGHQEGSGAHASGRMHPQPALGRRERQYGQASRLISTGRLNASPRLHRRPIDQVVYLVPSVSSRDMGCLISGRASRLDAFSGYPSRTWLPGACRWRDNRCTRGPSCSVLSY